EVVSPLGSRKDSEPGPHDCHGKRRMLRVAPRQFAGEDILLGHVGVDVLTALGENAVEGPEPYIADESRYCRALAPRGIGERVEQPLDQPGRTFLCHNNFTATCEPVRM